jgi:hypothetical protein
MNFCRRIAIAGAKFSVLLAALSSGFTFSLLAGPPESPAPVPLIDWCGYFLIRPDNCQRPYCEPTNHAVFELSFVAAVTPVHVEKSFDLVTWRQASPVSMSSSNSERWYWGEYVNEPLAFYRLSTF